MATWGKIRLLLLVGTSLFVSGFPHLSAASNQTDSWFDNQLHIKTQVLLSHSNGTNQRDQLLSVALLDEIYELRPQVLNATDVDALLSQSSEGIETSPAAREEAKYLLSLNQESPQQQDRLAAAVAQWASERAREDCEVAVALLAIDLQHHWTVQNAEAVANGVRTAEGWYLASRAANDEYHRSQALRRALELDADYLPALIDLSREYLAKGRQTRARLLIDSALRVHPDEPSLQALFAQMEIDQGQGSQALEAMNQLRSRPLPIAVAASLANSYAQLGFLKPARELAPSNLQLQEDGWQAASEDGTAQAKDSVNDNVASTSAPGAESARVRRLLKGEVPSKDEVSSQFFADVPELIRKWRSLPPSRLSESRVLADIRVDQLRSDYQTVQRFQQIIAIGSPSDIAAFRTRSIQYSPQSQVLTVARARIHHADGRVTEAEEMGESPLADASIATFYDVRAQQYRFRDLRVGDVIELNYTISPLSNQNPYGKYFAELVAFGGPLECDLQRYILRAPEDVHLSSAEHLLSRPNIQQAGDEEVYLWQKTNIAALVREPHSPSWSEQGSYVHISNFATWPEVGRWYAALVRPQFELNAELRSLVSEIVTQHPNRLDRLAFIDDLVLKKTRYVALEFGIYGFKPYPVAETFARGFGDCKDKASLMVALLRAAGIDADIALIRTRELGEILPQPASASIFDHAIVYVPEFDLWLDGTAEFARLHELPVEDQGVIALTIDTEGDATLRRTPSSSADQNYSRRTINARLDSDGSIHFSGATYVRGEDAPELRRQLEPGDSKLGYVRERLAQVLPAVEVRHVESPEISLPEVSLSFDGDLTTFRGQHRAILPSSWMQRNYLATLAPASVRTQELLLDAPWTTEEEIHIQLPSTARVLAVPKNQSMHTNFGRVELTYRCQDGEIVVLSTIQFSQMRIRVSEYPAFRDFTASIDEAFSHNIEVDLP